jgi:hypothetical protein
MQTPPSRTKKSNDNHHGSLNESPPRVLFGTPNETPKGTPKRTRCDSSSDGEDAPGTPGASSPGHKFSLEGLLHTGRGGFSVSSGPPPTPFKSKSKSKSEISSTSDDPEKQPSNALLRLPILAVFWRVICFLGAGSFGTVEKVVFRSLSGSPPGTPCSPPVAMKTVMQSQQQGPKTLLREAANVGSPGCASGVAVTNHDGDLIIFTSVAVPLSQMRQIGFELLEQVILMMKESIMKAPLPVVFDCKCDNLGLVRKGEVTVIADANGQPCAGPVTEFDSVVFLDLGYCPSPEEADKNFNPLLDNQDLETEEQQAKFREFKFEMMEALLRNQFADMPEDEKVIVARICTKYNWAYAGGEQHQARAQQLRF